MKFEYDPEPKTPDSGLTATFWTKRKEDHCIKMGYPYLKAMGVNGKNFLAVTSSEKIEKEDLIEFEDFICDAHNLLEGL